MMKLLKREQKNIVKELLIACMVVSMFFGITENVLADEYKYDKYNRLIAVVFDDGSRVTYTYDLNGNMLSVVVEDKGKHDVPEDNAVTPEEEQGESGEEGDNPVTPEEEQGESGEEGDNPVTPEEEQGESGEEGDNPVTPEEEQGDNPVTLKEEPGENGESWNINSDTSETEENAENGYENESYEIDRREIVKVGLSLTNFLTEEKRLQTIKQRLETVNKFVKSSSVLKYSGLAKMISSVEAKIGEFINLNSDIEQIVNQYVMGPIKGTLLKFMEKLAVFRMLIDK